MKKQYPCVPSAMHAAFLPVSHRPSPPSHARKRGIVRIEVRPWN